MRKLILVVTTVSALGAVVAFAQTAPGDSSASPAAGASPAATNPPSPVNATPTPTPSAANKPRSASASDFLQLQSSDMLTSNLVGLDLYDGQRNDLGKIKDVAFDPSKKSPRTSSPSVGSLAWAPATLRSPPTRSPSLTTQTKRSGARR